MNSDILARLLSIDPPDIYVDAYVNGEVQRLKMDSKGSLTILALNVILVLEGKRLAYRVSNLPELIPLVLEITGGSDGITSTDTIRASVIVEE